MAERTILKRYANRRLYDTGKSAYVTLDQVAEMIRNGTLVRVIEADSKEDITAYVLTQIVLEEAKKKNILLPEPLLHLTIRYGDGPLAEFFEKYLQETINGYLAYKSVADQQFRQWLNLGLDFSEMARKTMVELGPVRTMMETLFPEADKKTGPGENK
ncbi:MAG: polyhydroxyalkanoate synthesis regulator DNA-binding domain-containing protein [Thermodesulfobacteriota bacterium]